MRHKFLLNKIISFKGRFLVTFIFPYGSKNRFIHFKRGVDKGIKIFILYGRYGDNLYAELFGQSGNINFYSSTLSLVHKIYRNYYGNIHFKELGSKIKATLHTGCVDDIYYGVGFFGRYVIEGNLFLRRKNRQGINPGQVNNTYYSAVIAASLFYGYSRPVSDASGRTGKPIKKRSFSAIRVADKGYYLFHMRSLSSGTTSTRAASFLRRVMRYPRK